MMDWMTLVTAILSQASNMIRAHANDDDAAKEKALMELAELAKRELDARKFGPE